MSFDPDALIDGVAPAMGLSIEEENRAGVRTFLNVAAAMAAVVEAAPVAEETLDLAAVFHPVAPDDSP